MNGVINILKPKGMTSHDVVNILRKVLKTKKVGHTGTLDPNATGVLPICIGKATKISEYLLECNKAYVGELTLGHRTDTQDGDGTIILSSDKSVTESEIREVMSKYIGDMKQLPPMYSALKHNGKKLYELAREGITVEREPRNITIYEQNIINIEDNKKIKFYTKCSRGTYIRTICDDIGMDLGTYGYMSDLTRVEAGSFKIEDSYSLDYIKSLELEEVYKLIVPMDKALSHLESFTVPEHLYTMLTNGVILFFEELDEKLVGKTLKIYCKDIFIGTGTIKKEDKFYLKMNKVLMI